MDYQGAADLANTAWWENFEDPVLNDLIQIALHENKDLRIAAFHVEQFNARLGVNRADFYPHFGYGVSATRDKFSENRPIPLPRGTSRTNNTYEISANASWELDIWGRIRRSSEAARADLLSAEENQRAVIMTLISDVATSYVQLLSLDKELDISKRTVQSREESLRRFESKYAGGAISALELAQVRSLYEEVASAVPAQERQIALLENSLSILLGRNPGPIMRDRSLDTLSVPPVPMGIPSDILVRRPDIRQAEQDLIAANARIGVAKAQYFPTISLTGLFGYASTELSNLRDSASSFGTAGGAAVGQIFSGGRISGQVRETKAIQQQLLVKYLQTIQTAFREVEDALISHQKFGEQLDIENRRVRALQDYARLAHKRYEGGYSSYLEVLDAERTLYDAEITQAEMRRVLYSALIAIYKTMGGGWPVNTETKDVASLAEGGIEATAVSPSPTEDAVKTDAVR
jgi:multidrug efflux system outer membrane protein